MQVLVYVLIYWFVYFLIYALQLLLPLYKPALPEPSIDPPMCRTVFNTRSPFYTQYKFKLASCAGLKPCVALLGLKKYPKQTKENSIRKPRKAPKIKKILQIPKHKLRKK